jgi:hypothetical protein
LLDFADDNWERGGHKIRELIGIEIDTMESP